MIIYSIVASWFQKMDFKRRRRIDIFMALNRNKISASFENQNEMRSSQWLFFLR